MINLETIKPGDIVSWKGMKSVVRSVNLHRLEDMSTEVTGIGIKVLEGEDRYRQPVIVPGGFVYLNPWNESVQPGDVFEKTYGTRDKVKVKVLIVDGGQAGVKILDSPTKDYIGKLMVISVLDLKSDGYVRTEL